MGVYGPCHTKKNYCFFSQQATSLADLNIVLDDFEIIILLNQEFFLMDLILAFDRFLSGFCRGEI